MSKIFVFPFFSACFCFLFALGVRAEAERFERSKTVPVKAEHSVLDSRWIALSEMRRQLIAEEVGEAVISDEKIAQGQVTLNGKPTDSRTEYKKNLRNFISTVVKYRVLEETDGGSAYTVKAAFFLDRERARQEMEQFVKSQVQDMEMLLRAERNSREALDRAKTLESMVRQDRERLDELGARIEGLRESDPEEAARLERTMLETQLRYERNLRELGELSLMREDLEDYKADLGDFRLETERRIFRADERIRQIERVAAIREEQMEFLRRKIEALEDDYERLSASYAELKDEETGESP